MPSIDDPLISKAGSQIAGVVRHDAGGSIVDTDLDLTLLQVDANGALRVTGGGGGTEYTEDAAAPANPVGGPTQLVRADTPATVSSTDGDWVTQRGTNYGAAFVQLVTSTGSLIDSLGGGTEYTEDAAAAANPVGKANILVRADTPASEVSTNGDNIVQRGTAYGAAYCQIVDSSGNFINTFGGGSQYTEGDVDATITGTAMMMEVGANTLQPVQGTVADGILVNLGANNDVTVTGTVAVTQSGTWDEVGINDSGNSITVDNGGTFAVQVDGAALTALQLIDDVVQVLGTDTYTEATSKGITIGAVRRDADTTLVNTTNEFGPLQMDANGRLKVEVFSGETLPVSLTSTTITGTVAVTQSGTWDEVGINDSGNSITIDNATLSVVGGGVEASALRVTIASDSTGVLSVDDNGGSLTVDGTVTANLSSGTNTNEMVGDAAHDAAIAGNPVRIGGRALTSDYTAVAAGDTADLITTLLGKLVTIPFANPANTWSYAAASGGITNTTGVTIKAAAGAGVRNYITCLSVINGHASTSTDVQIRDGASGTVLWRGFAQAAGGGVREVFSIPIRGSTNTLLEVACGTTGTATYVNVQGYTAAE